MTELTFLSPSRCDQGVRLVSPLSRVLPEARDGLVDLSHVGKIEVRGDLDEVDSGHYAIRFGRDRALVLCDPEQTEAVLAELREEFRLALDQSAAFAALELRGEQAFRRLSDLDPDALPAAGSFARVRALVARNDGDTFLVLVAQEHGHYVGEAVLDALEGLAATP